jgi:hypothetical protein
MIKISNALMAENIDAYTDEGQVAKDAFHREGRKFLKALAEELNMAPGTYDLRNNRGGMAVSGEVTLHGERIYVQMSESCVHRGVSILYRTCKGQKDYTGGHNNFQSVRDLRKPEVMAKFIAKCQSMTGEIFESTAV